MQNRLDGATEAQAVSEKQLAELHSAIAAERAARPESVSVNFKSSNLTFIPYMSLSFSSLLGPTQRGADSAGVREENAY